MTRIILTRHGETEWNLKGLVQGHRDSPLTEKGMEQATQLAARLTQEKIKVLISSPLGRAKATAQVIAAQLNLPLIELPDFREINFGEWEGKSWEEIRTFDPDGFKIWQDNPHLYQFPGGENFTETLHRAKAKLLEVCNNYQGDTICIVSHGVTLKLLVNNLMGYEIKDWAKTPWQTNTAVNIFEVEGEKFRGVLIADHSHISDGEVEEID